MTNTTMRLIDGVEIHPPAGHVVSFPEILTPQALGFVAKLQREFRDRRRELLQKRVERQRELNAGHLPDFLGSTRHIRESDWRVAPTPPDLQKRWVEITGPVDRKMIINALNSGADVYMADFEDSNSPTWENVVSGQVNVCDAIQGSITYTSPEGKHYKLGENPAVLMVRPRGWHLEEKHVLIDGQPISASLFDFGLAFFHNARRLLDKGSGPYYYLPKMESHLEARLWNDVFCLAQDELGINRGAIRATVLIENILAAFEMDEILYELREHAAGLNAGRWDYIFSIIRKFQDRQDFVLPDRYQISMTVPFMRAYTELLVKTCHRRGAHAIGGMAAFIPSRRDPQVNQVALSKVREDKERESRDGFDGTWVAHPDLVTTARGPFQAVLGDRPHQKDRMREDVRVTAGQLIDFTVPGGQITEAGLRSNINIGLQYLEAWLGATGCVPIYNLMEDAATAEISRSQVWQWVHHAGSLSDGRPITMDLYRKLVPEELAKIKILFGAERFDSGRFDLASRLFDQIVADTKFTDFLTLAAYDYLD